MEVLAEKTELLMILFFLLPLAIDGAGNGSVLCHVISSSTNLSLGVLFNSFLHSTVAEIKLKT